MISYASVLTCHPETTSRAVHGIEVRARWDLGGALALAYALKGDLSLVRIPPPRPPRREDGLWRQTCFEAFVSMKDKASYCEFNLAPSGEWAVYAFRRYREGAPFLQESMAPSITVRKTGDSLELDALIRLERLSTTHPGGPLRLGLAAVIEERDGVLSYWALKHAPGKPDFHHPDSFALELGPGDG